MTTIFYCNIYIYILVVWVKSLVTFYCLILVTRSTIRQFRVLLSRSWRWRTSMWDTSFAWYSPRATHRICFADFEHSLGIRAFRLTLPWSTRFLQTDLDFFNDLFTVLWSTVPSSFKSHMKWSNAQCVNTPTTTILPTTAGTFHGLNCFGHVIYAPQTNTYPNIAKF